MKPPQLITPSRHRMVLRVAAIADHRGERPGPWRLRVAWADAAVPADPGGPALASRIEIEAIDRDVDDRASGGGVVEPGSGPPGVPVYDHRDAVLVPPFVNAHAHLDLTGLGPRPYDHASGFAPWLRMIRDERPATEAVIASAVDRGVRLSRAGGVVAVGDIAGAPAGRPSTVACRAAGGAGLLGVSFIEFFAIGAGFAPGIAALHATRDALAAVSSTASMRAGLQPHAPYSVSAAGYEEAVRLAAAFAPPLPLATHLAETIDERAFVAAGTGPKREFLAGLGLWTSAADAGVGQGRTPIEHIAPSLAAAPGRWIVAHVNDADDAGIALLARFGVSVAYCPRASAYFRAGDDLGPHRYRDMLARGVNVCLGTDSIVNLDTPERITPLDDARLLVQRDGLAPALALAMAGVHGAGALNLDTSLFRIEPRVPVAGLVLLASGNREGPGALARAMHGREAPKPLVLLAGA